VRDEKCVRDFVPLREREREAGEGRIRECERERMSEKGCEIER